MTSRVEELKRMCDNINENGGLNTGGWDTALLAQIAQNLAIIADVMMADRKTEPTISKMEQVDEPQTDCLTCKHSHDKWYHPHCDSCSKAHSNYEPQTDLVNDSQVLAKDLVDDEFNPYDEECMRCKHLKLKCEFIPTYCKFESRDEPQTERSE